MKETEILNKKWKRTTAVRMTSRDCDSPWIQPHGANIEPRGANIEPRGANIEFKNQNESTFDEKCELYDANKSKGVLFLFFFTLFIDSFLASSGLYRF